MRPDMFKVIVERPRIHSGYSAGRDRAAEELPFHESMRATYVRKGNDKRLNENLAPLHRYLDRQVGRPWSKVYSEICAHLKPTSTVQQHVRDHVDRYVAVKPIRPIGRLGWRIGRVVQGEFAPDPQSGLWWEDYYVDRHGLLKRTADLLEVRIRSAERRERRRRPKPVEHVAIDAGRELRLLDGLWFEVLFAPLPATEYRTMMQLAGCDRARMQACGLSEDDRIELRRLVTSPVFDVAENRTVLAGPDYDGADAWKEFNHTNPHRRYAVSKRQLSKRELRMHGLANALT